MSNTTLEPVYHRGLALPQNPFVGRAETLLSSGIVAFGFPHTHTHTRLCVVAIL